MQNGQFAQGASLPAAPVWAPNPAVPLPARILAYLFGGITLLAVLLGLVIQRPPDVPPIPKHWSYYNSQHGCSIPYPSDWEMSAEHQDEAMDKVFVKLIPDSPVQMTAFVRQCPATINNTILQHVTASLANEMSKSKGFTEFSERDEVRISDADNIERSFTFTANTNHSSKMAGAIAMRANDSTLYIVIAISPIEAWVNMKQIAGYMLEQVKFE